MRRGLLLLLALPRAAGNAYNSSAYAPLDGVVGDRLAQMVGFPSLAALAGPQDLMTSGEVALLVSGNLMLLEALAPHLLWLRRGPLFTDDASAGSAALGASRLPGAGFRHTTMYKLRHDLEQFEYLASRGWRPRWVRAQVVPAYEEVLRRVEAKVIAQKAVYATRGHSGERTALLTGFYEMDARDRMLLGSTDANFADDGSVVVVDDALTPGALDALLEYCRSATVFYETKPHNAGGHLGAYAVDGFAAPLLLQVAEELRAALPRTLADKPLLNFWGYKYQHAERGIGVHRDQSQVNVNLWLTPDGANLEPDRGGMMLYDDEGAISMADGETPRELLGPDADAVLADFPSVAVPYRQNRLVLFDSQLLHASDVGAWRPGYEHRRISLTFLFGDPSRVVVPDPA
ncbi:hypothetical protein JL721_1904 [Aureococcus anophagefferens]|nr:hypothetical protein JL721_1904 [Aureococcus anophagefferens]